MREIAFHVLVLGTEIRPGHKNMPGGWNWPSMNERLHPGGLIVVLGILPDVC